MTELKNCPFCGGCATWREYDELHPYEVFGLIVDHAPECYLNLHLSHEDILPRWNTRADGWQDIADAPRDRWIWICDNRFKPSESSHLIAKWHPQLNCWQGRMNTKGRFTVWHEATHWQPLPTPPAGDEQ